MNKIYTILISLFLFLPIFTLQLSAQSNLAKAEKDLLDARSLLESLDKKSTQTLTKYKVLKNQIQLQEVLLLKFKSEIENLEKEILKNTERKIELQSEIFRLQSEYEDLIYYAYKTRKSRDKTMYILSSKTFNQAYRRFVYLQYLTEYLEETTNDLKTKNDSLTVINENLIFLKEEKLELKEKQTDELIRLNHSKIVLAEILTNLQSRKEELIAEVKRKEKIASSLRTSIKKNIASGKSLKKSKESEEFEQKKGKLPFPVKGLITSSFGTHTHSVLKNVQINNDGIEIATVRDEKVKSVYKGIVSQVLKVPGSHNAVIIKHGQYYTVYSNLGEVYVNNGDIVKAGESIGKPDSGMMNFQIWYENQKLNPQQWLK